MARYDLDIQLLRKPGEHSISSGNLERRFDLAREVARLKRVPVDDALGVS